MCEREGGRGRGSSGWARQGARIVKSAINCSAQPISNQKRFNELHKFVQIAADLSHIGKGEARKTQSMGRGSN